MDKHKHYEVKPGWGRNKFEVVPINVARVPEVAPRIAYLRMRNLNTLFDLCGRDMGRFSDLLSLPIHRIPALLDGSVTISDELAMHIEAQLDLPGAWLDHTEVRVTKKIREKMGAGRVSEEEGVDSPGEADAENPKQEGVDSLGEVDETKQEGVSQAVDGPEAGSVKEEASVDAACAVVSDVREEADAKAEETGDPQGTRDGRVMSLRPKDIYEARRIAIVKALDLRGRGARVDLARSMGLSPSIISSLLVGRRRVTDDFFSKIVAEMPDVQEFFNEMVGAMGMSVPAPTLEPKVDVRAAQPMEVTPTAHPQVDTNPVSSDRGPSTTPAIQGGTTRNSWREEDIEILRDLCIRFVKREDDPLKLLSVIVELGSKSE